MQKYLARESNEQKGVKGAKKSGGGVNNRAAAKESELSSLSDDDSNSVASVQPRKKSRGSTVGQMSGGTTTTSVRVSRGANVAKRKKSSTGASAAKGKTSPDYRSDDFSSSSDDSTQKETKKKHSIKDLLNKIEEKDKMIRSLDLKLSKAKVTTRMNKTKVREELKWTGEETNFAETVNHFCRIFLFPKFKLLKYGWKEIMPDKKNSFNSLCMRHLKVSEGANKNDIWDRVIVPSVMRKYQHMKCNLNNDIRSLYMSMKTCLCESTFAVLVNYIGIYVILCLINTGERTKVWPDELGKGFQDYVKLKLEHVVYDFMCTYVRRMKPDTRWKKILKMHPGCPFICHLTPSDIAYVLAIRAPLGARAYP
jgi:hypothetical protein